ncbi:hypothetical protein IAU60_004682 [Kwoniella sp. DSM 27419]
MSTLDMATAVNGFGHPSIHQVTKHPMTGGDDDDDEISFTSPQEEISHYRERYRQAMDMLTETRAELEEFQQSSKELEDEMEQELAANDKQQADLKDKIKRLEAEKDEWKAKQIALQKMHSSTTSAMQREMDNLRSERDKTLVALRDLEMGNDELERNERVAVSSLLDLESKYNRAIEEKTLLEQEIIQKQELEEESQRLKDELRDANSEISILRDQLARVTIPTPPSSVSEPATMSPASGSPQQPSSIQDEVDPASIPLPPPVPYKRPPDTPPTPIRRLPRSATATSFMQASPVPKRLNSSIPQSPTMSSLSRSTTSRNLAGAAAPQSPALSRSRSGLPQSTPARAAVLASNQQTKSRGFKLLHDLQAKLKATDDKLGVAKVPRRNVSNPLSFGNRAKATLSSARDVDRTHDSAVPHARVSALAQRHGGTPGPNIASSSSNLLSPNGWVLVGESESDVTPTGPVSKTLPDEPTSPLAPTHGPRAVSAASNSSQRSLPSRPGIPSPLANVGEALNKSTGLSRSTSTRFKGIRPPSRSGMASSSRAVTGSGIPAKRREEPRPMSPTAIPSAYRPMSASTSAGSSRAMSPSAMHHTTRPLRAPSPAVSAPRPSSRSASRTDRRVSGIGRGPPPSHRPPSRSSTAQHEAPRPNPALSSSSNAPLRRSARRSSLGAAEAALRPTGIPAPKDGARTPARPTSMHVFGGTPPPVPRIPSALLRAERKR